MYVEKHGKPPSKRTVWLLGQQAAQNTRRTKAEARRTVAGQAGAAEPTKAQRLAAWEAQTARREVQALSAVHEEVARFAALRPRRAPAVLDDAAKRRAAHIVTGQTAPPDHPPYQQASPESMVKAILERDDADLSATEQIRHAQDWAGGTGHLLTLWSAAVRHSLCPQIDQQIKARLTEAEGWWYDREHSRPVLQQRLRTAQLAGHDIGAIIAQITAAPMDRARSISSVLHARLQQLQLPDLGHNVTWAQRTPKDAPAVAHQLAAGLDDRARALGDQLAASPEPWLAGRLGVLAPHASPLLREDYARRAAAATAYREAAGTNPDPEAPTCEPAAANTAALVPQHESGGRPAYLDALQARADEAVHHIAVGNAARQARAQYTARREREAHAQAEPAAERQAEPPGGIEMEL